MARNDARLEAGLALLRIVTGAVFLAHGARKLFQFGLAGVTTLALAGPGAYAIDAALARRRALP